MLNFKWLFLLLIAGCNNMYSQSGYVAADLMNKDLIYRFGEHVVAMKFSSDTTLYWKVLSSAKEAHEICKTVHLNDHITITAWYEADKTFVSLYSDVSKMETMAMVCRDDGQFYPISGTIEVAE